MRILLIEDHVLVSESIKHYVQELDESVSVSVAASLPEALELASRSNGLDAIILSSKIPGLSGSGGYSELARAIPGVPVVILSKAADRGEAMNLIKAGAAGVVPKHLNAEALILVLKLVIAGHQYIPSTILESLHDESKPAVEEGPLGKLTVRQRQVLKLLVQGLPNKAIAQSLGIQEVSVKMQLTKIFKKFGASNRTELVSMVMGLEDAAAALRGH